MTSVTRSPEQRNAKELPLGVGNYIVGNEIGSGSFATVYKGYHKVAYFEQLMKEASIILLIFTKTYLCNVFKNQFKLSLSYT